MILYIAIYSVAVRNLFHIAKLKRLRPESYPHVPYDKFDEWKRCELNSLMAFNWVAFLSYPINLVVQTVVAQSFPAQSHAPFYVATAVVIGSLFLAAISGSKAANLKKQYSIVPR